jgi:hypothetical protein
MALPTLYVKKIVSLNPTRFEHRTIDLMLFEYSKYLFTVHDQYIQRLEKGDCTQEQKKYYKPKSAKTFKQWLATEI